MAKPQISAADATALVNALPSAEAARAELERRRGGRFLTMFPDEGPYRRALYPKHMAFMAAGAKHRERLFLKANRTGGTTTGAFELTAHATGRYPSWWQGKRFSHAVNCWVAGDTDETTRDILQAELLGPPGQEHLQGTAMLPADTLYLVKTGGAPNAVSDIYVRHTSGDLSRITLKAFAQKRKSFQGTAIHCAWLDEECPIDIYEECLLRTMPAGSFGGGLVWLTFTPLSGLTPLVISFLPNGDIGSLSTGAAEVS